MAKEYGMLPHEIATRANTYDLMVMDVLATYENYQMQKASGKPMDPKNHRYSEAELMKIMERKNGK